VEQEIRMLAAALADDTTGALEIGALLAKYQARILLHAGDPLPDCDIAIFDTQSRHLPPGEARETVNELAQRLRRARVLWIYKKTDSTLRGPIGAEFDGLLDAFSDRSVVYAPAYPKLGRTLVDGILLVNGKPVAETEFGRDVLNPVTESSVPALIRASCRNFSRVTIHDAASEADMEQIAESIWPAEEIAAGPAGFAACWARLLPLPAHAPEPLPRVQQPLVVCGSLHPMSRAQAAAAQQLGVQVLMSADRASRRSGRASSSAANIDLCSVESLEHRVDRAQNVATELAQCAAKAVIEQRADCLILMGGDTARATFDALGCRELTSAGELAPGVPLSFTEAGLPVVTKAGGFGEPDLVHGILKRLT
jgi:uncharacterized protein YgbK (DUF1537 family)